MKYCVENDLSLFAFHDAEFSLVSFDGQDLVVSASCVNIHKNTALNPGDCDMEIAAARITFRNFHSATYEPGRTWKQDENGNSYPVGPRILYSGQEGMDRILAELKHKLWVYHFEKEEKGYSIGGCGEEPYLTIEFDFDGIAICWDEYRRKAWYERSRYYRYDVCLETPVGQETVELNIHWYEDPVYILGVRMDPPSVTAGCKYEGKTYFGRGDDEYWIDAIADLQRQLPEGVFLKCCLTCRHGNLCPFGNELNELFCTRDLIITQKSDLYGCTQGAEEREKRSRPYCGLCEDYQPQGEEYYTYNDFLDFLKKQ